MPLFLISWPVNPIDKYDFQSIIDQKQQCEITFAYPDGSQSTLYCKIISWPTASSLRVESVNNLAAESNNMQVGALKLPNGDTVVFDTIVAQLPRTVQSQPPKSCLATGRPGLSKVRYFWICASGRAEGRRSFGPLWCYRPPPLTERTGQPGPRSRPRANPDSLKSS